MGDDDGCGVVVNDNFILLLFPFFVRASLLIAVQCTYMAFSISLAIHVGLVFWLGSGICQFDFSTSDYLTSRIENTYLLHKYVFLLRRIHAHLSSAY